MKKNLVGFIIFLAFALLQNVASATTISVSVGGGDPWLNDYDVYFGLGDPATPSWLVQVAHTFTSDDFDLSGSASYDISSVYNPTLSQTWYVLVDDNWSDNDSYITRLTVTISGDVYSSSTVLPLYIADNDYGYAYVTTPATVPESTTLLLFGAGLIGLAAVGRRCKN